MSRRVATGWGVKVIQNNFKSLVTSLHPNVDRQIDTYPTSGAPSQSKSVDCVNILFEKIDLELEHF